MKVFLIHCTSVAGHHLEYLHHLYMGALARPDNEYRFVLPSTFREKRDIYNWPIASNIIFEELDNIDESVDGFGIVKKSYYKAKDLGRYVKKYNVTDILLIDLISYLPFLPVFVPSKVRVRGILYRIYLYEWKFSHWRKKMEDVVKYIIFSRLNVFYKVFILNDSAAASYLNRLYNTDKFCYLPDPIASLQNYKPKDIRYKYNIGNDKIVYLHPGGMLPYKGTLEILKSIEGIDSNLLSDIVFVFAGRITSNIKDKFFELYEKEKTKVKIVLLEGYLPFEDLSDLFFSSNYVLIPYKVKGQSSGIVGHSACYNKPVIVGKGGIIGKMVKKYHLGITLQEPSAKCISDFILNPQSVLVDGSDYVASHSVEKFLRSLYN